MRRNNGTVLHGQLPGFLGAAHASFDVDQELLADDVRIQAVERAAGLTGAAADGAARSARSSSTNRGG